MNTLIIPKGAVAFKPGKALLETLQSVLAKRGESRPISSVWWHNQNKGFYTLTTTDEGEVVNGFVTLLSVTLEEKSLAQAQDGSSQ
jgi:hypothetical protein